MTAPYAHWSNLRIEDVYIPAIVSAPGLPVLNDCSFSTADHMTNLNNRNSGEYLWIVKQCKSFFIPVVIRSWRASNVLQSIKQCITMKIKDWQEFLLCEPSCYCWKGFHFFGCAKATKMWGSINSPYIMERSWSAPFCWFAVATAKYLIGIQIALKAETIHTFLVFGIITCF